MKRPNKRPQAVPFETALGWLRRGFRVRRRGWHPESAIFRLGQDVFVKLPDVITRGPKVWQPYPQDFLATDWVKVAR